MRIIVFVLILGILSCQQEKVIQHSFINDRTGIDLVVLGTVQDGGAPHIGCTKDCCAKLWKTPDKSLKVVSLGIVDFDHNKTFIIEATPDFPEQLAHLNELSERPMSAMPDGIFITHAHIGHYTGLMFLGREAKGAKNIPVHTMPRLGEFLGNNGPWNQLVGLKNIELRSISEEEGAVLTDNLKIVPFIVPHRDEYSETVGFEIIGPDKKVLFIPDIDKWSKWNNDIIEKVKEVDIAFLDATFFDAKEINNRDISEIPHPFVIESMQLFEGLSQANKAKIYFIHLNHTNPLLVPESAATKLVKDKGFNVSRFNDVFKI